MGPGGFSEAGWRRKERRSRPARKGCSRAQTGSNPGEAGAGFAIFDLTGKELYAGSEYLGTCTNNVAEYKALLYGLSAVEKMGAIHVDIWLDSELIVRQIQGSYRVRHPDLKPLFAEATELIGGFGSFIIRHVRRENNKEADRLVNVALNRAAAATETPGP